MLSWIALSSRRQFLAVLVLVGVSFFYWMFLGSGRFSLGFSSSDVFYDLWATGNTLEVQYQLGLVQSSRPHYDNRTLGIASKIYVISLPSRTDRLATMEILRRSLFLQWTYVNATHAQNANVTRIMNMVRTLRQVADRRDDPHSADKTSHIATGGISRTFDWPSDENVNSVSTTCAPLGFAGSDLWTVSPPPPFDADKYEDIDLLSISPPETSSIAPSFSPVDPSAGLPDTVYNVRMDSGDYTPAALEPLTCASRNYSTGPPYAPSLPAYMLLTPAKIACWNSHMEVIRRIAGGCEEKSDNLYSNSARNLEASRDDDVTIVLEDDVDMERDIHNRLQGVWDSLPNDWDIVFLGHCWSNESHYPELPIHRPHASSIPHLLRQTTLRRSYAPKCTHAYALTRRGARRLLLHLRHTPFAYSRALDQALAWLVMSGRLKSFSVVPSVVVQRKKSQNDIDRGSGGYGSGWREQLADAVLGNS